VKGRQGVAREFIVSTGNAKSFSELIGKYL